MRLLLAVIVLLAGCASDTAKFVNDKGERRYCYRSTGGGLTSSTRAREFDMCANAARLDGFRQVDE